MESTGLGIASEQGLPADVAPGDKGLKRNAIGYVSNVVIAIASAAPGYSLAATLGVIVGIKGIGVSSPAVLLVSFVPMLMIAAAYKYLNRADPDCGTTFVWVTRAMGPRLGWLGGWASVVAGIVVMGNLAQIAGIYTFDLFRWHSAANSHIAVLAVGVAWIVLMTWICYVGVKLSARTQMVLLGLELITLAAFAVVALVKVYANHPAGSIHPAVSWFNPFDISSVGSLTTGVLLGIFIYWGWDSTVSVNEESENPAEGPGSAAVLSTILLLLIFLIVSAASQAYAGTTALAHHSKDVLTFLGDKVFPRPLDLLIVLTTITSAAASTQTTILPTARTALSMSRWGALPKVFGRIQPRYQTPDFSTLVMGALSVAWFVLVVNISNSVIDDTLTATGFAIAFYYGLTGIACPIFYRRRLLDSARNFLLIGLVPLLGGVALFGVFVKGIVYYSDRANAHSLGVFGIGLPVVIGIGSLLLGVVAMLCARFGLPTFFRRRREVVDPAVLDAPS
jgi:amino acid transporter